MEQIPSEILTEYSKAQDSAEHHNKIMWNLIYLGIGLSLYLLLLFYREDIVLDLKLKIIMLGFGALILMYFSQIIEHSHKLKRQKYRVCKEIEKSRYKFKGIHSNSPPPSKNINVLRMIKIVIFLFYVFSLSLAILKTFPEEYDVFNMLFLISSFIFFLVALFGLLFEIKYIFNKT